MADKITSLQVAERAGVSQSAVSRVFTPGASVSEKTAKKVRAAAQELGYRPNVLARSLITGKSRIIGLVVAYLENQFYPEAIEKLSHALQAQGYHVLVFMASNDNETTEKVIDELLDYQVDGIITASVSMSSNLTERCDAAGIPIVMFNRQQDDDRLSCVRSDNVAGGLKVAEHLLQTGHKRIAHIAGWDGASTTRDRETGLLMGLAKGAQTLFARGEGMFKYETACEAARQMFTAAETPDAVFVTNDHMAFAVMDVLRFELGLRVPEDVSVVGYDDVQLAAWPAYNLTTVRQPVNRMVDETVDILMTCIQEPNTAPRRVAIDGPLILRGSTRNQKGKS